MDIADQKGTAKETLQRLGVPTAVGVLGAGAGLILTRKPNLGNSLAGVKDGVGGVLDDLRNNRGQQIELSIRVLSSAGTPTKGSPRDPNAALFDLFRQAAALKRERR